jgi:hypothetical protein
MATQKADKATASLPPQPAKGTATSLSSSNHHHPSIDRETDEYVVNYLRTRLKWGKLLTYVQPKLEGQAQELQAIQHYNCTSARCSRPRKRQRLDDDNAAAVFAGGGGNVFKSLTLTMGRSSGGASAT